MKISKNVNRWGFYLPSVRKKEHISIRSFSELGSPCAVTASIPTLPCDRLFREAASLPGAALDPPFAERRSRSSAPPLFNRTVGRIRAEALAVNPLSRFSRR